MVSRLCDRQGERYSALCQSGNQAEFTAEVMMHLSGLKYIANPGLVDIPEGFRLLGLRLFVVYHPRN